VGNEAAVYVIRAEVVGDSAEAVLLVDVSDAFMQ